ncbi:hypothetical protein C5S39_12455 [Candidatus Methanophagaceae archaeon]|jgi:hypothetical protein|nr:hypothetical protein C5S39_12455 [Methanophagales archaeon]
MQLKNWTYPASLCYIWEHHHPFMNGITVGAEAMAGLPSQNPPNGYIHAKTQKEEDLVR